MFPGRAAVRAQAVQLRPEYPMTMVFGPAPPGTLDVSPHADGTPADRAFAAARAAIEGARYREIRLTLDRDDILWCFMRPAGPPSFTPGLLRDLRTAQLETRRLFRALATETAAPFRYIAVCSDIPGMFNLGGDLALFARRIRARDREGLRAYAHACVEVIHAIHVSLDLPVVTIALARGDALGGGFEAALACDVLIAEKGVKFGLPEVLFNLFPGMGAYSFLSRRLDAARAERIILGGRLHAAEELHEMGLVDVLAEPGQGEEALRDYVSRARRRHNAHRAVYEVRRRVSPLTLEELQEVTDIWVEAAFRLSETDLRKMERLHTAQARRLDAVAAERTA